MKPKSYLVTKRILQISLLIMLSMLWTFQITATDPPWFYYYFKEQRALELNEQAIAAFSFEPAAESDVASYLQSVGLEGFQHRSFGPGWTLFERPAASATPPLAPGSSVVSLIEDIAHRKDNPYFLSPVFGQPGGGMAIVPPDVLVRFNQDVPAWLAEVSLHTVRAMPCQQNWGGMTNAYAVNPRTLSGFEALAMANELAEMAVVKWAEPGFIVSAEPSCAPLSPNPPTDPSYSQSWGLEQLNDIDLDAQAAWAFCAGSPTIKIAIIDDGVDLAHEDLNVVQGFDCMSTQTWTCGTPVPCTAGGGPVNPVDNHGTAVAGVAVARANGTPSRGSLGIAPKVSLVAIRTQDHQSLDPRRLVNGLAWAASNGVRVTNYSWNLFNQPGGADAACAADKYFETRAGGMVHFSSAGNADTGEVFWPASLPQVNAVSAIDSLGNRWVATPGSFGSNYGPQINLSAPGGGIFTADRTGAAGYSSTNYSMQSGTSYASPFAAGVAALVLSVDPTLSADAVEAILCRSATDAGVVGKDPIYGCGIVNAAGAIALTFQAIFIDGFESGDTRWWSAVAP